MAASTWVIGGAGFLGSKLVARLRAEGQEVLSIDPMAAPGPGTIVMPLDAAAVPRLRELARPQRVFHLAGSGSVSLAQADPLGDLARTVESTAALLHALCEAVPALGDAGPAPRLVFISSAAVYGDAAHMPIAEEAPLHPLSLYGAHKLAAEELVRAYGRVHGLSYAIVRFFSLYGPGLRKQLPWDACLRLSQGAPRFGGSGAEERDWLHVDDAVELLLLAAGAAEPSLVVNGGSGIATRVDAAIRVLADHLPGSDTFSFSGERREGDPRALVADAARARALGFSPRVSLSDGLADYARWFSTLPR